MNSLDKILKEAYRETVNNYLKEVSNLNWVIYRVQYPGLSDKEIKEKIKQEQDKRKITCEFEDNLHKELTQKTDLAGNIARLHSPDDRRYCKGCDWGGYEGEAPDWPCRTWRLLV
jgi:hypothetical protein